MVRPRPIRAGQSESEWMQTALRSGATRFAPRRIVGIDPGSSESSICFWLPGQPGEIQLVKTIPNAHMIDLLRRMDFEVGDLYVIERVSNYGAGGMGDTLLDTIFWSGRFAEIILRAGASVRRLKRQSIRRLVLGSIVGKDKHIRAELIRRYGGDPTSKKKEAMPDALVGVVDDDWASLAICVAAWEDLRKSGGDSLSLCESE